MGCNGSKIQPQTNVGGQLQGRNRHDRSTAIELHTRPAQPTREGLASVASPTAVRPPSISFSRETRNGIVLPEGSTSMSQNAPADNQGISNNTTNRSTSILHHRTRLTASTSTGIQPSGSVSNTTPVDFLLTDAHALLTFTAYAVLSAGIKFAILSGLCFFKRIGQGASFEVRLSEFTGTCHAVKVIRKIDIDRERKSEQLRSIILELRALSHPPLRQHKNIVNLIAIGWMTDDSNSMLRLPYLVLEYADQGTFHDLQKRLPSLAFGIRKRLCLDIAEGLKILHTCGVVHGDVKAENILVFTHPHYEYVAKLGDFGCSILEDEARQYSRLGGTYPWTPPELKNSIPREEWRYTDLYSYGLLVWRSMLDEKSPFDTLNLEGTRGTRQERIQRLKEGNDIVPMALDTLRAVENSDIRNSVSILQTVFQATLRPTPTQRNIETVIRVFKGMPSVISPTPSTASDVIPQLKWGSAYQPVFLLRRGGLTNRSSTLRQSVMVYYKDS